MNRGLIFKVIVIGGMIFAVLFVDVLKVKSGLSNFKEYVSAVKKVESYNSEMENLVDETSKVKKKLSEIRGADAVDLEDVNALFNAVTSIEGVENSAAKLLRITGKELKILDDYSKDNPEKNNKADGVQIMIQVKDINAFIKKLGGLKTPYTSLNVIYPENKIVVTYNTKGGQL